MEIECDRVERRTKSPWSKQLFYTDAEESSMFIGRKSSLWETEKCEYFRHTNAFVEKFFATFRIRFNLFEQIWPDSVWWISFRNSTIFGETMNQLKKLDLRSGQIHLRKADINVDISHHHHHHHRSTELTCLVHLCYYWSDVSICLLIVLFQIQEQISFLTNKISAKVDHESGIVNKNKTKKIIEERTSFFSLFQRLSF